MTNAYKEVGTLKEIGAQVGDVVQWVSSDKPNFGNQHVGKKHTIQLDGRILLDGGDGRYWGVLGDDDEYLNVNWRIISRATPSPVRTVTRQEIVPGAYGHIWIDDVDSSWIAIGMRNNALKKLDAVGLSFAELDSMVGTLTAIRDAMQANDTA